MKAKTYSWNQRFQNKDIDPKKAERELARIRKENDGNLTMDPIVEAARDKKNVLHPAFEWRDKIASHKYRCHQARVLVGSLEVVYVDGPKEPTRAMQVEVKALPNTGGTIYAPTTELLEKTDTRNQLLLSALRELAAFRRKYSLLSELSNLIPIVDAEIENLRKAVNAD